VFLIVIGNNQLLHDDICQMSVMIQPRHHNKQMIMSFETVHTLSSPGSMQMSGPASTDESRSTHFLLLDSDGRLGLKGVIEAIVSG